MKSKTKKIAILGVLTSVALVLSYLEAIIPPIYSAVPGIKVGLPNIVIILVLYRFGFKQAISVSLMRVFIVALLFGNAMTLAYSLSGAILSLLAMVLFRRIDKFSQVGVSIIGGVMHNLGQVLVAIVLLHSTLIGYYMLILTFTGTLAGVVVGIAGSLLIRRLEKLKM
ncbi:MAG: Gx transporter family protein [Clostridia bacterium]|nr:Gx transporter family protein [Clostridia bacterium]